MPHYYFNIEDHGSYRDDSGTELADNHAARIQAVQFAGEYLRDNPDLLQDARRFVVEVSDDAGTALLRVSIVAEEPSAG